MALSLDVQQNGTVIHLALSYAQRTFARAVHGILITVLGPDAIAYATVIK
jgi:hypothetical protein